MSEELREGDIVTLGDSPTRWRAVRDLDGSLRLVNIGTPETDDELAARAKEALRKTRSTR